MRESKIKNANFELTPQEFSKKVSEARERCYEKLDPEGYKRAKNTIARMEGKQLPYPEVENEGENK